MFEEFIVTAKARMCNPTVVSRSIVGGAHQLGQVTPWVDFYRQDHTFLKHLANGEIPLANRTNGSNGFSRLHAFM